MTTTYQTFCDNITQQLFDLINLNGSLLAWQKTWNNNGCSLLPEGHNGLYHGSNLIKLLMLQNQQGFTSNQWLTFNQVNKLNGTVKKGAKSQLVYFWKLITASKEQEKTSSDNTTSDKTIPIFKTYRVFNLEQTSLKPNDYPYPEFKESTITNLLDKLGVKISHFGNQAYYNSSQDIIVLPQPSHFTTKSNYYAALLHELTHWTGGRDVRLPRECFNHYGQKLAARAEEELIAEIGSVLLTTHFGLRGELENHASYVHSWQQHLDAKQIMRAAHKAAKAFEWLIKDV